MKLVILPILGILAIILVSGCTSQTSSPRTDHPSSNEASSYSTNPATQTQTQTSNTVNNAVGGCRSLMPARLKLECQKGQDTDVIVSCVQDLDGTDRWADGTAMERYSNFFKGQETGQNANYFYMRSMTSYHKDNVAADGTIGEPTEWEIGLAVDIRDNTTDGYKVVQYACETESEYEYNAYYNIPKKWLPM